MAENIAEEIECPFCAELIKSKAKICRYCKSQLFLEISEISPAITSDSSHESDFQVAALDAAIKKLKVKPCRFCSESIKIGATVCRFCNREQDNTRVIKESDLQQRHGELEQAINGRDFIKAVSLLPQSQYAAYQAEIERRKKNTGIAYLFTLLFVGFYGAQKFYIGEVGWGIIYLLCNVLGVFSVLLFFISPVLFLVPLFCCLFLLVALFFDLFLIPGQVRKANDRIRIEILEEIAGSIPMGNSAQELNETFAISQGQRALPLRLRILGGTLVLLSIIGIGIVAAKWDDLTEANTVRDYGPTVETTPTESSATVSDNSTLLSDSASAPVDINSQLDLKLSPQARMIVEHFSNMVEGTDESLKAAYTDFSKDWRQRQSLSKFMESARKGTWQFGNHLLPEDAVISDQLTDNKHALVDVEMNYFSPSPDSKPIRFFLVKEGKSWKILKGTSIPLNGSNTVEHNKSDSNTMSTMSSPSPSPTPSDLPRHLTNPFVSSKGAPSPVAAPIATGNIRAPSASIISSSRSNIPAPTLIFSEGEEPSLSPHPTRSGGSRTLVEQRETSSVEDPHGDKVFKSEPKEVWKSPRVEPEMDYGPYMADVQRKIKRGWFPPKGTENKIVAVVFKIGRNGTMTNLRITESSNYFVADQAALKAVENAAPFRPLPDWAPAELDVKFNFDSDALRNGTKSARRF